MAEFQEKVLDVARVSRVVAGGKRFSFRATVVIGDGSGQIGIGIGNGADVASAVNKGKREAKKNIIKVSIVNDTLAHEVEAKYSSAKVRIKPAKQGKGLIAGSAVRQILSLAGYINASAKILGRTSNKLNNAKATIEALKKLKTKN